MKLKIFNLVFGVLVVVANMYTFVTKPDRFDINSLLAVIIVSFVMGVTFETFTRPND